MKTWVEDKANSGKPFFRFFGNASDFAWGCFVLKNMMDVWGHEWKYSEHNEEASPAQRADFEIYRNMSAEEAEEELRPSEKKKWEMYRARKSRFTSDNKRVRYSECVSIQGLGYYYKILGLYTKFFALPDEDPRMGKFIAAWEELDTEHRLTELKTKRKRKHVPDYEVLIQDDGVFSTKKMVFPGDVGYEEHLKEMEQAFQYSTDDESEEA